TITDGWFPTGYMNLVPHRLAVSLSAKRGLFRVVRKSKFEYLQYLVVLKSFLLCGLLLATGILFGQQPVPTDARQDFVIDRTRLPQALQQVRLEHLSSGALMLLDHNGDLVHPPTEGLAPQIQTTAVALDPRVGPNVRLGDDPSPL